MSRVGLDDRLIRAADHREGARRGGGVTHQPDVEGRRWTVDLPGKQPLSLNARLHWSARHRLTKAWRNDAALCIRAARIPRLAHAHVEVHVSPPDRRRRDADNLVLTQKTIVDALRDTGVLADDTPNHVTYGVPIIHPPDSRDPGQWAWWLIIHEGAAS